MRDDDDDDGGIKVKWVAVDGSGGDIVNRWDAKSKNWEGNPRKVHDSARDSEKTR